MKATKDRISLKTAKQLKDSPVASKFEFFFADTTATKTRVCESGVIKMIGDYPAYTWQEILWENAEKFFGEEKMKHSQEILKLIQMKKYQKADNYFRENCKLINS